MKEICRYSHMGHAYICWKQRNKEIIFPYNEKNEKTLDEVGVK